MVVVKEAEEEVVDEAVKEEVAMAVVEGMKRETNGEKGING